MFQKLKRKCRPTTILLAIGFSISIMSVLVGISAINDILTSLAEADQEIPIFNTMQTQGFPLHSQFICFLLRIALWLQTIGLLRSVETWQSVKRSAGQIITSFARWYQKMAEILLVSLCIGFLLIEVFSRMTEGIISIHITPFFLCGTLLLLLFTLVISVIIPVIRILKIHPAEVIS